VFKRENYSIHPLNKFLRRSYLSMINLRKLGWNCGKYKPGGQNAITDVPGVSVGHSTIITGEGKLVLGKGPVRTGICCKWLWKSHWYSSNTRNWSY
jgi:hypothetical protein